MKNIDNNLIHTHFISNKKEEFLNLKMLSFIRVLQIYVVQGILCAFFLFFAVRILSRQKKKLNYYFSLFYISEAIGLIINFIYAPLENEIIVKLLNFVTNFFSFYAVIFLLVFIILLYKTEKAFDPPKQIGLLLLTGVVYFCMIFIAIIPDLGVEITEVNDFTPHWGWLFFLYIMGITTGFSTIPTLYYIFKIYKSFKDENLKQRWKYFFGGILFLYGLLYSIFVRNTFFPGTIFSTVLSLFGLVFSILGSILIYYGVGRQLD
ncbi:MAG: hypothetical protein GF317_16530 [Candidatus Lokiarchaeota archaeon]|nr:hypothetical protein [Candidatus Lokiarchaeota archaeon]